MVDDAVVGVQTLKQEDKQMRDWQKITLTLIPFIVAAILWIVFWVMPNDAKNRAIEECMGLRMSEAAYFACLEKVETNEE